MRTQQRFLSVVLTAILVSSLGAQPRLDEAPPESGDVATSDAPVARIPHSITESNDERPAAGTPENLAAESARDSLKAALARIDGDLARMSDLRSTSDQRISALASRVQEAEPETSQSDALDETLVAELIEARRSLRGALDAWRSPPGVERPRIDPSRSGLGRVSAPAPPELTGVIEEIYKLHDRYVETEKELRWEQLEFRGAALQRLTSLRVGTMEMTTPGRRDQIFGLTREGLAQLRREIEHLGLTFRLYLVVRQHDLVEAPGHLLDPFVVSAVVWVLMRLALVLLVLLAVQRRWKDWLEAIRTLIFQSVSSLAWKRRIEKLVGLVEIAFPWLWLIVTIEAVRWAIEESAKWLEIDLTLRLVFYYAVYRLAIDLVVAILQRVALRYELRVTTGRRTRLVHSVRVFFRVAFALVIVVLCSRLVFGGGYIAHIGTRFASLVMAITLFLLLLSWRKEIADAFLERHSEGPIAVVVRETRDRWYGVFVAPASFLWIAGRAVAVVTRDFAMGFDQTRRALAYLFRRKIEKQAEKQGYADGILERLPSRLLDAFSEDAIDRQPGAIDYFPELDRLHSDVTRWFESGHGGSALVVGEKGVGKTSWLNQVRRQDVEVSRIQLGRRVTDSESLGRILTLRIARGAGLDGSLDTLARHLNAGASRLVILDLGQHLFLSTVGGYDAWSAFAELVDRTRHRVFWLCAMSLYAWNQLRAVRHDWAVFRRRIHLDPWSEERIRALIRARMDASGCRFSFSSLVLDRLEGVSSRSHLVESEEGYARLLWDYSDGNPRAALHFFVRSLDAQSENRMRVRLFRAPDVAVLEESAEAGLFLLAAIVNHESISIEDLVAVTRYSDNLCLIHLDRMTDLGIVEETEGLYHLSTHWHPAVVRTLRRCNLRP